MIISRVIVEDFKTFRGRTSLSLPSGVSVIVGRNGSGKSNLVDAIRWGLGEQDLASLRLRTPADVLSRGAEQDSVAERALVSLALRTSSAGRGSEMVVTRSYQPSLGESYLVDGAELTRERFLEELRARGVQVPLATAIRQGDVGRLLWLHPAERTILLCRSAFGRIATDAEEAELLSARASSLETEQELERLEERREELRSLLAAAPARTTNHDLAGARARLLGALAPSWDDPLLSSLLQSLELPRVPEGPRISPDQAAEAVEAMLTSQGNGESLAGLEERLAFIEDQLELRRRELESANTATAALANQARANAEERRHRFLALHQRIEDRFARFFQTLVPEGEAGLPLIDPGPGSALPGIGVAVRFPQKPPVPLDALSGGQLTVVGLCLALAAFLEIPSPALVLDEVEPALDEALVRRLTRLLAEVGRERQVLAVSHQPLMRYTAGQVMWIERKDGGSRLGLQYDPRLLRGPSSSPLKRE